MFFSLKLSGVFTIAALLTASLNVSADTMSSQLDFSRLYNRTNAGRYDVKLNLDFNETASLKVSQELAQPPGSEEPFDPNVCVTQVSVNIGNAKLDLVDAATRDLRSLQKGLTINFVNYDQTDKCTPVAELLAGDVEFMPYFFFGNLQLKYRAPADFETIQTSLHAFPFGYSVKLKITTADNGEYKVINLKQQLAAQIQRGNKEGLSYYTYAQSNESTMALGSGYAELK